MIITDNEQTKAILSHLSGFPGFDEWFDGLTVLWKVEAQVGIDAILEGRKPDAGSPDGY